MVTSLFHRIRAFLQKYNAQIYVPLMILLLSLMSYMILRKPTASGTVIPEWGTKYLLIPVILLSLLLSALKRYFISLSIFIGYHVGVLLAVVGISPTADQINAGKATVLLTFAIIFVIGLWIEIFAYLLPKWRSRTENAESKAE